MRTNALACLVLDQIQAQLGVPPTSSTQYLTRWEASGCIPLAIEHRLVRFINVWLPWPDATEAVPKFGIVYGPTRTRNSNLPVGLRRGNRIICLKATRENLDHVCRFIRPLIANRDIHRHPPGYASPDVWGTPSPKPPEIYRIGATGTDIGRSSRV